MGDFLQQTAGPWTMYEVCIGLALVLLGFVAKFVVGFVVTHQLARLTARTASNADDLAIAAVSRPLGVILPLGGLFLGIRYLVSLQPEWTWLPQVDRGFRLVSILLVAWTAFRLVNAGATLLGEMAAKTESQLDDQFVPLASKGAKVVIATLGFVLVAQNLGYSVSGLLAGLGIGGLALAMAAKDTLANLFGSLMIMLDRPFRVGDFVTFSGGEGTVEEIGMRSTRVRTPAKTVVSIPNQNLANATVENQSLMPRRRVRFTLGVTYDTSAAQMEELVTRITGLLRARDDIDPEQILVRFTDFGASSLDVLVQYFTVPVDFARALEIREQVNLQLMRLVEEMGLSIAFPTRTVHLAGGRDGVLPAGD